MADEVAPETLARARRRLVSWLNERAFAHDPILAPESLDDWPVEPVQEFLIFSSPGGYAGRHYLVGDDIVRTFIPAEETIERAVAAALADRYRS
jgi:hypothetical protein